MGSVLGAAKPGYKTTEFYGMVAVLIEGGFRDPHWQVKCMALAVVAVYIYSRSKVKHG